MKRKKTRARSVGGVSAQAGNAALAAWTTASTVAAEQSGVCAMTSPREGLKTGDGVGRGSVGEPFTADEVADREQGRRRSHSPRCGAREATQADKRR